MTVGNETPVRPLHKATWELAENWLPDVSEEKIKKGLLDANQTAGEIWDNALPLLDGGMRARKFWDIVPVTPLLQVPDECLPKELQNHGHEIYLLADGMMPSGAYKLAGVMNALLSELELNANLSEVHVASTGNHAASAALASILLGLECTVYMPEDTVWAKVENTQQYGARIQFMSSLQDSVNAARKGGQRPGAKFIHPYDQLPVIAGQGSAIIRLRKQLGAFGIDPTNVKIMFPVGGTGNAAGNAVVGAAMLPGAKVHVAQAEGYNPAVDGAAVPFQDRGAYGCEILGLSHFVQNAHDMSLGRIGEAMAVTARFTDLYEPAGALALAAVFADIRQNPAEHTVRIAHGSGINTTPHKASEFAQYAYTAGYLKDDEAYKFVSRAGVDSRRRNSLEEHARTLAEEKAGVVAVRHVCRIAAGHWG